MKCSWFCFSIAANGSSAGGSAGGGNGKPKFMVATPEQVMKLYMSKLTPYEHHEIFNYPQIYFIGANAKKRPGIIGGPNNCGYDDEQGSYTHIVHDHLAYRSAHSKHTQSFFSSCQVWSLTQFYSVDFSKSRIDVKKCIFNKRTFKVCVNCC